MIYNKMGETGPQVSRLGFGCMRFPTREDGKIDRAPAAEMLETAYEGGVNYFDTAYLYHEQESERFVGDVLAQYPRASFHLATKLPIWLAKTGEGVDRMFHEQMEKCRVDYFDFYLLHSLDRVRWPMVQALCALENLQKKKEQGLIRNLGFSYHGDFETFRRCLDACDWDFVQIQINYVDYTMIDSKAYHDELTARGIPCVVMEPIRGGYLANLPARVQSELRAANSDPDAHWALRWCMDMPNMPVILSGMSTLEQVRQNLALFAQHRPMTAEEQAALARAKTTLLDIKTIPCTGCGYCMDCPFGVDIPDVFAIYNRQMLFNTPFRTKADYAELAPGGHQALSCTRCGACAPLCPQGIAIPEQLAMAHRTIDELVIS